jgi:hypothetical protein
VHILEKLISLTDIKELQQIKCNFKKQLSYKISQNGKMNKKVSTEEMAPVVIDHCKIYKNFN